MKAKFKVQKWRLWSKGELGQNPTFGAFCVVSLALFPNLQILRYKQLDINNCCIVFSMFQTELGFHDGTLSWSSSRLFLE